MIIEPQIHRDGRGFFLESYHKQCFQELGLRDEFVQDNHSRSQQGVLRGIHYQDLTAPMAKLVQCTSGRILDVAVDLRLGSPSFARWVAVELSADDMLEIFVPVGFGHAFLVLSEWADVQYKTTGYYARPAEGAVAWNDPEIGIEWPAREPILSARDQAAMSLREYRARPAFLYREAR